MLDNASEVSKPNQMDTHPYNAGREEMREQAIAFIYNRYIYYRTFFGKESQTALELKSIILDLREDQAKEQEKTTYTSIEE